MNFDSINPYESLVAVVADSPQDLVRDLKAIKTPIKIVSIVQSGTKSVAYIMGDIRTMPPVKKSKPKE